MLNKVDQRFQPVIPTSQPNSDLFTVDINSIISFLRRHVRLIGLAVVAAITLGIVYIALTPPEYTASTSILIDPPRMELLSNDTAFQDAQLNTGAVESHLQVLGSQRVAGRVVKELKLEQDPEFTGGFRSVIEVVVGSVRRLARSALAIFTSSDQTRAPHDPALGAVTHLQKNMSVKRLGMSYVIQVSYTSLNPDKAAKIANAIASAYIADQLEAKYQAAERAGSWLQSRILELRDEASEADSAVQTFKSENSIINTGPGRLLTEVQADLLNTQLLAARNESAQARARYMRLQEINRSGEVDAGVQDILDSEIITRLRQQYLDTVKKEREWSERYGAQHSSVVNLRVTLNELQTSMKSELARLEGIYKSNLEIAEARERELEGSLAEHLKRSAGTMQAQVKLRELESSANSYRSLYSNFLQRYLQAVQQQSFPVSEARLITPATPPDGKSFPKPSIILPLSLFIGFLFGTGAALISEFSSLAVKTNRELEAAAETTSLGVLPFIETSHPVEMKSEKQVPAGTAGENKIRFDDPRFSAVTDDPFSLFAETIRSIKVSADINNIARRTQVIGVISSTEGEGKSLVSCNLARLAAQATGRTLLIDGDLRRRSLTHSLAPKAEYGLLHVLSGQKTLAEVVQLDDVTGMHFLPVVLKTPIAHTSEILASDIMDHLIDACRGDYNYIILDLPPILPVVDVRAAAHLPDGFVMVVEWGKTTADVLRTAVNSSDVVKGKILGAVLNKVDMKTFSSLEPARATYYRGEYY